MNILNQIYSVIAKGVYQIGFINGSVREVVFTNRKYKDINWVNTRMFSGSWFADPFILDVNDNEIRILAEEYVYKTGLGRISMLIVNKYNYILEKVQPIIDLSSHLSFPYIVRKEKFIYVIPENNQSGSLYLYQFNIDNCSISNVKLLINEPLVDSQYCEINGMHFIYGMPYSNDNFEYTKMVNIYRSENLFGPYKKIQTINSCKKDKRGAGSIFCIDDRIIRPTQLCEGGYGKGVIFYELLLGKDGLFQEKEVGSMYPHMRSRYPLQLHTYNEYKGIQVIDGYAYSKPLFRHLLNLRKAIIEYGKK